MYPAVRDSLMKNGKIVAIPVNTNGDCLGYNTKAWEKLGLTEDDLTDLKMRYIGLRNVDGEIRQNYYFFGQLKQGRELESTEGKLQWIPYDGFDNLNMPVSAKHMILHYLQRGRFDDVLYAGITEEAGTHFVPMMEFEG